MTWELNKMNEVINLIDWETVTSITMKIWLQIIGAIFVLWIWFKIVKIISKAINKVMERAEIDSMLKWFIQSLVNILLRIMVFISAAWVLWVETSSFVAMLAAAGLAVGMALSGTLQNFAGWVMILMLKPFKNGDFVEVWWFSGTVQDIQIFNTILLTPDKKKVIIPNADISNGSMINYSSEPVRRLDLQIGVWYEDDIDKVKEVLKNIAEKNEKILQDEWITIDLFEFGDNAVIFNYRFFVEKADYWTVRREVMEEVKRAFDSKWISFPFPQRDIHVYNETVETK